MKALTLHQPWASLVSIGVKFLETRSWATKYRGRLLIHAGLTEDWRATCTPAIAHALQAAGSTMPEGAVVASCVLTDCVQIGGWDEFIGDEHFTEHDGELTHAVPTDEGWALLDSTDQLPFGDFTPGRYAWLLDDVKPTTERCPRCWGSGWIHRPLETGGEGEHRWLCPACTVRDEDGYAEIGRGFCEPVPARGHQGLWTLAWEPQVEPVSA